MCEHAILEQVSQLPSRVRHKRCVYFLWWLCIVSELPTMARVGAVVAGRADCEGIRREGTSCTDHGFRFASTWSWLMIMEVTVFREGCTNLLVPPSYTYVQLQLSLSPFT